MNTEPVRNRDRCGRCKTRHGGNNSLCPVHGPVSKGCCENLCNQGDYVSIGTLNKKYPRLSPQFQLTKRSLVDLTEYKLDPPYKHQDDGKGNYRAEYVERYVK